MKYIKIGVVNMGKVKFTKSVEANKETNLLKLAKKANMKISTPCSGKGSCGKCVIKISKGKVSPPTKAELKKLGEEKIAEGYRLACQIKLSGDDVTVKLLK